MRLPDAAQSTLHFLPLVRATDCYFREDYGMLPQDVSSHSECLHDRLSPQPTVVYALFRSALTLFRCQDYGMLPIRSLVGLCAAQLIYRPRSVAETAAAYAYMHK